MTQQPQLRQQTQEQVPCGVDVTMSCCAAIGTNAHSMAPDTAQDSVLESDVDVWGTALTRLELSACTRMENTGQTGCCHVLHMYMCLYGVCVRVLVCCVCVCVYQGCSLPCSWSGAARIGPCMMCHVGAGGASGSPSSSASASSSSSMAADFGRLGCLLWPRSCGRRRLSGTSLGRDLSQPIIADFTIEYY